MQNVTNELPQQPDAKIIVDGLFILCVNEEKRVAEIGVYEYANEHELFVRVSKKEHGIESDGDHRGDSGVSHQRTRCSSG